MPKSKQRKKKGRPGLTEQQKREHIKNKMKVRRKESTYSIVSFSLILLYVSLETFAYDLFEHYNWNVAILDSIYLILEIILIVVLFGIGCIFVWVINFFTKEYKKNHQRKKTPIKSFAAFLFIIAIAFTAGFFFFTTSINWAKSLFSYYF
ncbi:hypothetical protein [Metabacillus malikii]|uniref:ABC-type multidrug transport system fused ATPase/permease subunit n=1 Tax=Metabacillus malikii TaxID=1504265 RepID=A0ABT9Z9N3_9BACI|nr:hypothetical protein [Metabacillus malikii]MDQ0228968.1 ABC-type multidrug transport system fused ATPase/permease subunit [Metabacillus malikii]